MNKWLAILTCIAICISLAIIFVACEESGDDDDGDEQSDCDIACQKISACNDVIEALGVASSSDCQSYCKQQDENTISCINQAATCEEITVCADASEDNPPTDDDDTGDD